MKQFTIIYPSGLRDEEVVSDCDTVEAFINRKFGSVDVKEYGITVEMKAIVKNDKHKDNTKDKTEASGNPTETVISTVSDVLGTKTEVVPTPKVKPKDDKPK